MRFLQDASECSELGGQLEVIVEPVLHFGMVTGLASDHSAGLQPAKAAGAAAAAVDAEAAPVRVAVAVACDSDGVDASEGSRWCSLEQEEEDASACSQAGRS